MMVGSYLAMFFITLAKGILTLIEVWSSYLGNVAKRVAKPSMVMFSTIAS
jgi:hypothetical protein